MYRKDDPVELRSIGETEFVNGAAAMCASGAYGTSRVAAGIVGYTDLTGKMAEESLDLHLARAGDRFKGVRFPVAWDSDPSLRHKRLNPPQGLMQSSDFRRGLTALQSRGLALDAWIYHPQILELATLADAFPQLPIIVNHLGAPLATGHYSGRKDEVYARWKSDLTELAKRPNVYLKLGGLGMPMFGFHHGPTPSSRELSELWCPLIETAIGIFGCARCMFESNFPMDKELCSFSVLWNAFKRSVSAYSGDELDDLFWRTAARAYSIRELLKG